MSHIAAALHAVAEQMAVDTDRRWHAVADLLNAMTADPELADSCSPELEAIAKTYLPHRPPGFPRHSGGVILLGPCASCGRWRITEAVCECSHGISEHSDKGKRACSLGSCGCNGLRLKPPKLAV